MKRFMPIANFVLIATVFLLPLVIGVLAQGQLGRVLDVEIGKATNASTQIRIAHQKHFDEKDFSGALVEYRKVTNDYPESDEAPEAQFRIGNIYHWNLKDLDKAIAEYQKVTDDYPGTDFAFESLIRQGECYARLKQYDTALSRFQSVVSAAPGDGKSTSRWAESIQSALDEFAEMEAATAYGLEHLNDVVLEEETE